MAIFCVNLYGNTAGLMWSYGSPLGPLVLPGRAARRRHAVTGRHRAVKRQLAADFRQAEPGGLWA
jgi:hypothetical protein